MPLRWKEYIGKETLYLGGISVAVVVLLYANVYVSAAAELETNRNALTVASTAEAVDESDSEALVVIHRRMKELQALISLHARKLPDQEQLEEVVAFIFTTGDVSGLRIERMAQNGAWAKDADYVAIPLQISFAGNYQQLVDFLTRIENSRRRIFVVDDIVLTVEPAGSGASVLKGRIDVRTFYRG